jgi:16S rRNA processing protein RimM
MHKSFPLIKKGNLIQIGKIIKLSGHSGELIVYGPTIIEEIKSFEAPVFIELDGENVPFYLEEMKSINKERAVVKFQYVNTEKKAINLIDKNVLIISKDEKKDKMKFSFEGFTVIDEIYGEVGEVKFIDDKGKNPLMVIQNGSIEIFIPFQEEFILGMDKKEKILMVKCPEGLLDLYFKDDEEE